MNESLHAADEGVVIRARAKNYRRAVSVLFFLQGICFATWASRIPTIQQQLSISEAALGLVLLALTIGSLVSLMFSGWLTAHFGSKKLAGICLLLYPAALAAIGYAGSVPVIVACLVLFGALGNLSNIAINTQAVAVEKMYGRSIMASFHGLWSLAGFAAAGIGAFAVAKNLLPQQHFIVIAICIVALHLLNYKFLLTDGRQPSVSSRSRFTKPPASLIRLGLIALCCMICEGAMFDWTGVYFKKVVQAPQALQGAGYTAFMCAMAAGRFLADRATNRFSFVHTVSASGVLIATGLLLAVLFPYIGTSVIGFLIVGLGVSSVVPLVYSQAGKNKTVAPATALTAVSSIGFFGFLVGPPVVGFIAGVSSLRISFLLIAFIGLCIIAVAHRQKNGGE